MLDRLRVCRRQSIVVIRRDVSFEFVIETAFSRRSCRRVYLEKQYVSLADGEKLGRETRLLQLNEGDAELDSIADAELRRLRLSFEDFDHFVSNVLNVCAGLVFMARHWFYAQDFSHDHEPGAGREIIHPLSVLARRSRYD